MKYDAQLSEVVQKLPSVQNILIVLSSSPSADDLASGLALLLSLQQAGKKASIATEGVIRVEHTHLFGVGQIQNRIPQANGGNFTITLSGVVTKDASGQEAVPALEKLRWEPQGSDLKLIFQTVPGQKFEPTQVTPSYEGGNFDLIFTLGVTSLDLLGNLYSVNQQLFSSNYVINIDNKPGNTNFGRSNVLDPIATSISEMMVQILPSLQLPMDQDSATNLLSGIFEATNNLQGTNLTADTYQAVAQCLRAGGQKPGNQPPVINPLETTAFQQIFNITPPAQVITEPSVAPQPQPVAQPFIQPVPQVPTQPVEQSSPEEAPDGETATSSNPEADWLTPKIYKGSSIG